MIRKHTLVSIPFALTVCCPLGKPDVPHDTPQVAFFKEVLKLSIETGVESSTETWYAPEAEDCTVDK